MTPEQEAQVHRDARRITLLAMAIGLVLVGAFVTVMWSIRLNRERIADLEEPTAVWHMTVLERLAYFEREIQRLERALGVPTPVGTPAGD